MPNLTFAVVKRLLPRIFEIISAGQDHTLIILPSTKQRFGWGVNTSGQIGDNTTTAKATPVSILGSAKTFCKISAGITYSLAIEKNGQGWAWGANTNGRLGDNTTTQKNTPVRICGSKTFCNISAAFHSLALDNYGKAWAWGNNSGGRLGDNSITSRVTPVAVCGNKTFCQITAGGNSTLIGFSLAIDLYGKVWAWGQNPNGQLADNSIVSKCQPIAICGNKTFCQISAGQAGHVLAIDKNGKGWCWGNNASGRLGDNSTTNRSTPIAIFGNKTFCQISAGGIHSLAIDKSGKGWAWGSNTDGNLGDNSITARFTPVAICGNKTFCRISAAREFSFGIDNNGVVWAWGRDLNGELGDSIFQKKTPVSVLGNVKTFCNISVGFNFSVGIDKNGKAWGWGTNGSGQLGDNGSVARYTPVSVLGAAKTFCKISAGQTHTIALDKNLRVWAWGANASGQLGDNTLALKRTPVSVGGAVKTFCEITGTGLAFSMAIDIYGQAWAWGAGNDGQLGNNSLLSRSTPVAVVGVAKTFCKISAGSYHSAAIDYKGKAWAWGVNVNGALGDNTIAGKSTPVAVLGNTKTFCKIFGAFNFTLAIDYKGKIWSWGLNTSGQLGDNTVASKRTPVFVGGAAKTFCEITGGNSASLAIDKNGKVWGWGANSNGQLGNNTLTNRSTPVAIAGGDKTFCKIALWGQHVIGLDVNGILWGWGVNSSGQLGLWDKSLTPIRVCNL